MSKNDSKSGADKSAITSIEDIPKSHEVKDDKGVSSEAQILINHHKELSGKRLLLTIHGSKDDGGNHAVFVGLNGVGYNIPRDKTFNVPEELVQNLENAQETTYEREGASVVERKSPRFAFSVRPAPDAVAA
jgi:hypothetical protein